MPLTDGVEPETTVAAELDSCADVANDPGILAEVVLDKGVVWDPAEETDSLRVGSVAVWELQSVGFGPNLRLGHPTDGKKTPGDLILVHLAEEVGLVFDRIDAFEKTRQTPRMIHSGVVTAGNIIKSTGYAIDKGAELDQPVAEYIRTRSPAGFELDHRGRDDGFVVVALERNDLEGNLEALADLADKREILFPGAATKEGELVLEPDLEVVRPELVVTFLHEARQRHRGVNPTGYENGYSTHELNDE